MTKSSFNYLDLFSGIGGFALGAYWAGVKFNRHYFSEVDPYCIELYQKRFPDAIPLGDIRGIDGNALDKGEWIITGGFPCQDISIAGKGAGISGERSGLWFEYWRLINDLRPRYAIMENVGMLIHRGLREVLGSLAEIGYNAEWQDIRASDMGAPHKRERIWIIAYPECLRLYSRNYSAQERQWETTVRPIEALLENKNGIEEIKYQFCRVDDGLHEGVDRLKGLGNSIVPQIAEILFRQIFANIS